MHTQSGSPLPVFPLTRSVKRHELPPRRSSCASSACGMMFYGSNYSIQFICIAQFHKLQICLGVLYNLYT